MDLETLGKLAYCAYTVESARPIDETAVAASWQQLSPAARANWRAAADAVWMAVTPTLPQALEAQTDIRALRERIAMALAGTAAYAEPVIELVQRAKAIERYVIDGDVAAVPPERSDRAH